MRRFFVLLLLMAVATAPGRTQAPSPSGAAGPTFDVVSIKKNTTGGRGSNGSSERPDASFTLLNIPAGILQGDGRLGPGITKSDVDCDAQRAAERRRRGRRERRHTAASAST